MYIDLDKFLYDGTPKGATDRLNNSFAYGNDFCTWNDEDWTLTGDTPVLAGSAVSGFQIGGWASLTTTATDEDEAYMTTSAQIKCDVGRDFAVFCRLACTEAAANSANIVFGVINAGAANLMIDAGGGPIVAADKALIYKVDGGTVWNAKTAKTTGTSTNVQTTLGSNATTGANMGFTSAAIYELGVVFKAPRVSGRQGTFRYFINGLEVATHAVTTGTATTSVTAQPTAVLTPVIGIKTGSANAQALLFDWLVWKGRR